MMRAGVLPVESDLFRGMGGIVDLEAVDGNLLAQAIEQLCVEAYVSVAPSGMGDQADGPAAMCGLHDGGEFGGRPGEASVGDELARRWLFRPVAALFEERDQGMRLLRARLLQKRGYLLLLKKGVSFLAQVLADLSGVLALAARDVLRDFAQRVRFRLKPVAEHIHRLALPCSAYLYRDQQRHALAPGHFLQRGGGVCAIVIGDSAQTEALAHQVIQQLLRRPCAVAIN